MAGGPGGFDGGPEGGCEPPFFFLANIQIINPTSTAAINI